MAESNIDGAWGISEQAARLHSSALVWDEHCGFAYHHADDLGELVRWAGAGCNYLSINVGYDVEPWTTTVEAVSQYRQWLREHSSQYLQVQSVADVHRAKREGKLAVSFDIEGMESLHGDVGMVDVYYRLGVRHMLFAYNRNNLAGGGCHDDDQGLTEFGRKVVSEMNRVGMVVDCSHTGYRTSMQVMEAAQEPVIFSHSNARSLCDHERNIRDDQIDACAATGGVVGVTGVSRFLGNNGATVEHFVEHIDYMVERVGAEHVGFGMDSVLERKHDSVGRDRNYWPEPQYPDGLDLGFVPPESLPQLTQKLLDRGYDETSVRAIMGENFLRVAGQVWKTPGANDG